MKNGELALLAAASLLSLAVVADTLRGTAPGGPARPGPAAGRDPGASRSPRPAFPVPDRDPFRFGDGGEREEPVAQPEPPPFMPPAAWATPPPTLPRLRVLGIVRQADRLRAMITVEGTTALAGAGEVVAGHTVLSVDEETVRLRAPDGAEVVLEVPLD